ncbi:MAG: outer membrane protein transport protein [Candidatus Cloacimonetes bacterium]|nr:outer membrane protein transport protein [Candidatus Cloacimonadota bacterium]
MKRVFFIITLITIISGLYSYSILEKETGNIIGNLDPHSAAMGSAVGAGGFRLLDSMVNPANLTSLEDGFGFQGTGSFLIDSDNRSLPMYNSFDAYCGDAVYASNVNTFADFAGGIYYNKAISDFKLAASFQYRPQVSFKADYFEQVRNNRNSDENGYPPKIAQNSIESKGGINALVFQTAFKFKNIGSLGLEVANLVGDSEMERSVIWTPEAQDIMNDTLNDTINTLDREFTAIQFKVGANIHISPRFDLGLSFTPKVELDVTGDKDGVDVDTAVFVYTKFDSTGTPTDSLTYAQHVLPMNARVGFSFKPRNIMRTVMNCDVEYVKWSDTNPLYDDAINYYIGVEHVLTNSIPFRFGFNYTTSYGLHEDSGFVFANEITTPTFTAGTGFTFLEKFTFDISLEYSNRQYEALDLFMDNYYDYEALWENYIYLNLQDRGWENPDTVNETFINLKSAISFTW